MIAITGASLRLIFFIQVLSHRKMEDVTLRRVIAWIPRCLSREILFTNFHPPGLYRISEVCPWPSTRVLNDACAPTRTRAAYTCTRGYLASARGGRWGKYAPTLRLRQVAVFKSPETYARLERRDEPAVVFLVLSTSPSAWHCSIFTAFRKLLGKAPWPIIAINAVTCASNRLRRRSWNAYFGILATCVFFLSRR